MQAAQKLLQTLVGGCSSEEESCSSESDSESGSEHEEGAQAIGRQVKVHYYWRMRGEWDPRRHEGVLRMNSSGKKVRVELCNSGGRVVEMKVLTERELVGMGHVEAGDDTEVRSAKAVLRDMYGRHGRVRRVDHLRSLAGWGTSEEQRNMLQPVRAAVGRR